jgi:hypothetical protein
MTPADAAISEPRTWYGDVRLGLSDALYAHGIDEGHGHWSPMRVFDPCDVERLAVQDAILEAGDGPPEVAPVCWYATPVVLALDGDEAGQAAAERAGGVLLAYRGPGWKMTEHGLRCDFDDVTFARWLAGLRRAAREPYGDAFLVLLRAAREAYEREAQRRAQRRRWAAQHPQAGDWADRDFRAEVEAVCGEGKPYGRQVAYRCPFHGDEHPSMHVDYAKKVWICRVCQQGGGVTAWRRAIDARVGSV